LCAKQKIKEYLMPIKKFQVQNSLLKKYIKFFWGLHIDHIQLNHKLIPQRNINMRFNLSNTPHYVCQNNQESLLEDVYFLGLQNQFTNAQLKLNGRVNILGICFEADGIYPFLKIPVSEFKNQILGADEIGFKIAKKINEKLKEASDIKIRLEILENELLSLLNNSHQIPTNFRFIFNALKQENSLQLTKFCQKNNISLRQLERMYIKYVGLSANTYTTLNRFHCSLNQLLNSRYSKLSDLAYDNEYFDQMHFVKEFKRFTGNTPRKFLILNNSILQIGKLT
jgi:AraC-like DNA-binding protein